MIPIILLEKILSLFGYIPYLCFRYYEISADIDTNHSFGIARKLNNELSEVDLFYIKNKKMRISLFLSGIFKKWYIYKINLLDDDSDVNSKREKIYITKDKNFTSDDVFYTERISDYFLNKKSLTDFHKTEPQLFVIFSKKTTKHDLLRDEQNNIYNYKKSKSLEKVVKKIIKDKKLFSIGKLYGVFNDKPIIHIVAEYDRIDLMKKILNSAISDEERNELVNYKTWKGEYSLNKKPIDYAKSDEMKELLNKWNDLSKYDRYNKIIKIKKGI